MSASGWPECWRCGGLGFVLVLPASDGAGSTDRPSCEGSGESMPYSERPVCLPGWYPLPRDPHDVGDPETARVEPRPSVAARYGSREDYRLLRHPWGYGVRRWIEFALVCRSAWEPGDSERWLAPAHTDTCRALCEACSGMGEVVGRTYDSGTTEWMECVTCAGAGTMPQCDGTCERGNGGEEG